MKKIELHLHLDGSIDIDYASKLMGRDVSKELEAHHSKNLKEYLEKFSLAIQLLQTKENIEEFSYLLAKKLEDDEVIYAEIRFCPLFHTKQLSVDEVVSSILNGFQRVSSVKTNLIFCMMRNFPFEKNKEIIDLTKKYLGKGVCAIDLAGDEAHYKTSSFKRLFDLVKQENIPFTIHAGEADSFASVDCAIEFGAKRIGHGVRSIESPDTIHKLISNHVTLELCPTSNLDTNVYSDISLYPIKDLVDLGVIVTINTDNRTVSETNLEKEYQILKDHFHFTKEDFIKFNLNAIEAAFLSNEEKEKLRKQLLNS